MNIDYFSGKTKNMMFKPISQTMLRSLGISKKNISFVENIEELRKSPPNIVIAKAKKDSVYLQNNFKLQEIKKKKCYVMGLGTYQQLWYDVKTKNQILQPAAVKFKGRYKPYTGQDLTNKTILVWRTGGIGDLLFIQPNLIYMKEKWPSCKIIFACGPQYQTMVETWECIDELIDLPFGASYLTKSDYHAVFEGVIERSLEAHQTNSYRLFTKWLGLNLPDGKLRPKQKPKQKILDEVKNILKDNFNNDFILVQLRASSPIRTPRPQVMATCINRLIEKGHNIIITDRPEQNQNISSFINKLLKDKTKVFNFSNYSKSLDYLIALTQLSNLCLSIDSSLIHIAQSVGTPAYGIYGPFLGEVRLSTYTNIDWQNCKSKCSPCFLHGHVPCHNSSNGYGVCFDSFDYDKMITSIEELLNVQDNVNC